MIVTATFIEYSIPQTGLSPTIKIYRLSDKVVVVNGVAMDELGDGVYIYDFTAYDDNEEYYPICDGGVGLANRYSYPSGTFKDYKEDIQFIKNIESGKWKIEGTQMIFYKPDNVTEIMRFNLKDINGNLSNRNVFERIRV